jgi:hypothetical protein
LQGKSASPASAANLNHNSMRFMKNNCLPMLKNKYQSSSEIKKHSSQRVGLISQSELGKPLTEEGQNENPTQSSILIMPKGG